MIEWERKYRFKNGEDLKGFQEKVKAKRKNRDVHTIGIIQWYTETEGDQEKRIRLEIHKEKNALR
ncbi:MAG: hypothetical protein NTW46_03655, partial [Candidatus Nealsonbacteria bacterium]|nr:hypothetical protein [Candidatus Nealsonbacteria bacterium]